MSTNSLNYCKKCLNDVLVFNDSYLKCNACTGNVHTKCIPSGLFDSGIAGDVFFLYTCWECSPTVEDVLVRDKISWFMAVVLALYDMSCKSSGISNQGYFHWKTHIINFIDRNWQNLFSHNLKRRRNWLGTIAGVLSHNSPSFFLSGSADLYDNGWWKLTHDLLPGAYAMLYNDVLLVRNKERNKFKQTATEITKDEDIVLRLLREYGLEEQHNTFKINLNNFVRRKENVADGTCDNYEDDSSSSDEQQVFKRICSDNTDNANMIDNKTSEIFEDDNSSEHESETFDTTIDDNHVNEILQTDDILNWKLISNDLWKFDMSNESFLSDSSGSYNKLDIIDNTEFLPIKSLFKVNEKARIKPWSYLLPNNPNKKINALNEYEENEIQKQLKQYLDVIDSTPTLIEDIDPIKLCEARRLYCKLNVRNKLRRKRDIEFNLDKLTSGQTVDNIQKAIFDSNVLDKFQVVSMPDIENVSFATRLTGISVWNCFVSPYTNRTLKPFIRRDYETIPPWIKLMNQIKMKVYSEQCKRSPIDYCYVRPHHVAAINSLCEQFYWPGINVSDVLQYPDYTVVALYKKLVVGFGLLVPDANHNEAYISFFWTRPNWQRCGIGSFMLYHLIQTCIGKDITLHVSATNTALILYQKFGFKVEEFIQDFYDKYMPASSKECRHALFLRLSR